MLAFLLTDIEEEVLTAQPRPEGLDYALYQYHALIDQCAVEFGGDGLQHQDSRILAVLESEEALRCALEIVRRMKPDPAVFDLSPYLRVAIHAGEAFHVKDEFFGVEKDRSFKLLDAARGRHILLSEAAAQSLIVPPGARLRSLGVHLLKDLFPPQELFALTAADMPVDEIPLPRTLSSFPHNLEPQATPFFGRGRELDELGRMLEHPTGRLVTILAGGGFGKSRLALQAGADRIERFKDGVFFINLGSVRTEERLLFNIMEDMQLSAYGSGEPRQQLMDFLREKEMLLILDNFEQIVAGTALIQEMLSVAPRLRLLITTRQRLRVPEESVYELGGLEYPKELVEEGLERYPAIQLFIMAARKAMPDFAPSMTDLVRAYGICRLLNGMPLGIELAAARVTHHSLSEIHRQIETNQEAMATGPAYIPERHRSLRAVFEYSWSLLSESQQRLLMDLSVFRSPFTVKAAQMVARAKPEELEYLADQSLLVSREGTYEFHEIVQYYSKEKLFDHLAERRTAEEDHARYFARFVDDRIRNRAAFSRKQALDDIALVIEDIQFAWGWALDNGFTEEVGLMQDGLQLFYEVRGFYREGHAAFQKAAENLSEKGVWPRDLKLYARALFQAGFFSQKMSRLDEATRFFIQALDAAKLSPHTKAEMGLASLGMGLVAEDRGQYKIAYGHLNVALTFLEKARVKSALGWVLNVLSRVLNAIGDHAQSEKMARRALACFEELKDTRGMAWSQISLGTRAFAENRYEEAKKRFQKGLAGYVEFGDRGGIAWSFINLGMVAMALGEYSGARQLFREAQIINREVGDRRGLAWIYIHLGRTALATGEYEEAERMFKEGRDLYKEVGDRHGMEWSSDMLGNLACARNDPDTAEKCYQEGEGAASEVRNDGVMGWRSLHAGVVAHLRKDHEGALRMLEKSVGYFQKLDSVNGLTVAMSQIAKVHMDLRQFQPAEKNLKKALLLVFQAKMLSRVLDYLMALARILSTRGEKELVYSIMTLAYGHPALRQEDRDRYREFYSWVQEHTPEEVVLKVLERSEKQTVENLVARVLDEPSLDRPAEKPVPVRPSATKRTVKRRAVRKPKRPAPKKHSPKKRSRPKKRR